MSLAGEMFTGGKPIRIRSGIERSPAVATLIGKLHMIGSILEERAIETLNLEPLDLSIFSRMPLNEIIAYAENLQVQNLEGAIHAHNIYSNLIHFFKNDPSSENVKLRGHFRKNAWTLEKSFGWNQNFTSQCGQDKFVFDHFFRQANNEGFFVDIGASDGVHYNNTYFFEKVLQWKGIAIEASRSQFEKLANNRSCTLFNRAVSNKNETMEFIDVTRGLSLMSGLNTEDYQFYYDIVKKDPRSQIDKYKVETATFSDLVGSQKNIDYLSIDIEGGEKDLLESLDFSYYDIKVLSVENPNPSKINHEKLFSDNNYQYFDCIGDDQIFYNRSHFKH